ncbi:35168_t:CDS:2 [Gigaspora margarita]|uniref:35168_t:CDS:1 n=1 Tax=Gigaspora margarita TaxID=4874 RepID=A0ABN7WL91_GIGMA|nr:35168_t:CDS:2 [Gigaspora margarita]
MTSELNASNLNDPLYSVRSFINTFNSNLVDAVRPGSTLCIDESMNSWLDEKNKIPGHRKILQKPHPVGQEWKTIANGFTNIIIQLEPCEEKKIEKINSLHQNMLVWITKTLFTFLMQNGFYGIFHVKKRCGWPFNYPWNMIQNLENTYRTYFSKVAVVNNVQLIVASLKD